MENKYDDNEVVTRGILRGTLQTMLDEFATRIETRIENNVVARISAKIDEKIDTAIGGLAIMVEKSFEKQDKWINERFAGVDKRFAQIDKRLTIKSISDSDRSTLSLPELKWS